MFGEPLTINDLPNEMLCIIFEYVPPYKDLDQCKLVCKKWLEYVTIVRNRRKRDVINNIRSGKIVVDVINDDQNWGLLSICRFKNDFYVAGRESFLRDFLLYKFDINSKTLEKITITGDIPQVYDKFHLVNYEDELFYFTYMSNISRDKFRIEKHFYMYSYEIKSRTWVKQRLRVPFNTNNFYYLIYEDNVIFYINQCREFHILNFITMSWWTPKQINPHLYPTFFILKHVYIENNNWYFLDQKAGVIWKLKFNMTDKNEVWTWTKIIIEDWQDNFIITGMCWVSSSVVIDSFLICFAATVVDYDSHTYELTLLVLDFSRVSEEKKMKLKLIKPYKCSASRKVLFIEFEGVDFTVLGCPCYSSSLINFSSHLI